MSFILYLGFEEMCNGIKTQPAYDTEIASESFMMRSDCITRELKSNGAGRYPTDAINRCTRLPQGRMALLPAPEMVMEIADAITPVSC